MLSSTSPGTKGFTTTARRHRSKAPTESVLMHGRPGTFACLAGGVAPEPSFPNAAGAKPPPPTAAGVGPRKRRIAGRADDQVRSR